MSRASGPSRRGVLTALGAGVGLLAAGTRGVAAAPRGRYIIGTSGPGATDAAKREADVVHHVLSFDGIGEAVAGRYPEEALRGLRRRPDVRYVEPDGRMEAISIDADDPEVPWGVDRVDAERAHADGATGDGADVAILDSGIDSDHPDLAGNLGTGLAVVRATGYAEDWDDDNGHGTHCAGTADALGDGTGVVGVSTAATLHAVKVLGADGWGYYSDIAAGLEWVADRGYDVASMSLGGPTSSTIEDACRYAADRGVCLVAAAGNDGTDVRGTAPATYGTVIAVSATDSTDDLASFSNYGAEIELAAPGVSVESTYPGGDYAVYSGTSMACPHVAGAAGQLMAAGDSAADARARLKETAEDIGLTADEQGAGLLDVEAAVAGDGNAAPAVSWVTPADGEMVSGDVTVQIDASDDEDADDGLSVRYTVDDGTARTATYDATSGYYEDALDTTALADGDHALAATATDSAGATASASVTVTTDNTASAPAVDELGLAEAETSDGDAEFDATWGVSDADGDLSTVELTLTQEDGTTEDDATVDVSGDSAGDTTRLVATSDEGSGATYTVTATVTDGAGASTTDTASATETEETASAPTVERYTVTEAGSPNPHAEITADWAVADADGDLASVTVTVANSASTTDVGGTSASGTDEFKIKHAGGGTFDVTLTVTDGTGASASTTRTVTE